MAYVGTILGILASFCIFNVYGQTLAGSGFNLYFEAGQTLTFQHLNQGFNVSISVDLGLLNATNGDLWVIPREGQCRFTCQNACVLSLSHDGDKNIRMVVDGQDYASPVSLGVGDRPYIWWREELSLPFDWTLPVLGMVGAFLFIVSPYYTVTQVKKGNYMNAWMYGILMFIFGLGLIMAWLWS